MHRMRWTNLTAFIVILSATSPLAGQSIVPEHFSVMQARSIGPAGMSGRVSDVEVVLSNRNVIFVGSASGGVWKSDDGGLAWRPVFDDQPVGSIGAIAVFQPNPDVVWAGTGEGNPRNSAGVGNGIYKSLDGGESWTHMGLEDSGKIHRVVVHPSDPDIVYVAAMGPTWRTGGERGVYRTRDGGETWTAVLQSNDRSGAGELIMDPANPDKLFAALWEHQRWPWIFESGGPGSGLYVTRDGGDEWTQLTEEDGLPPGDLGRMGLAIPAEHSSVVYALVEAERSELLRSDDGGRSWRTISDAPGVAPRPFYYADIRAHPSNENRIYSLHGSVQVSEDAGRTFTTVVSSDLIHGDIHELWIDPDDPRRMILGNDGGIAFTYDRGRRWRFVENLPLAQFYHIEVDMEVPFNVYGGLQDNGSWWGPSDAWGGRGVMNAHWHRVVSGDGFIAMPDLRDPRYGYSSSQRGNFQRFDKVTGQRKAIRPAHPDGERLRFHWNAAFARDPIDSTTIYAGSQFVHRSRDYGSTWEVISPDLTTNDPSKQVAHMSGGLTIDASGAEDHTTILTIAPSALEAGLMWVGSDDGRVHVTRDGGGSWTSVEANVPGVPEATWIPHIEPGKHDPSTAYLVYDDHRRGNWTPYAYRTEDYGQSWQSIASDDIYGFVHVIEEDPVEPNLLFLGTEFGLYVSLDRGAGWWKHPGVPPTPVRAIVVHPRDGDLALGTHGRAALVVDDVRPLRALAADPALAAGAAEVMPVAPVRQHTEAEGMGYTGYRSVGHTMFIGPKRPYGALIHYWLAPGEMVAGAVVQIADQGGDLVRTLAGTTDPGLNRVVWDLRDETEGGGIEVMPGSYSVRVNVGPASGAQPLEVLPDHRYPNDPEARAAKIAARKEVAGWITTAGEARDRLERALDGLDVVLATLADDDALSGEGRTVSEVVRGLLEVHFTGPECQGGCGGQVTVRQVQAAAGPLATSWDAPTANELSAMNNAATALETILDDVNAVFQGDVARFRQRLEAVGFTLFPPEGPLRVMR